MTNSKKSPAEGPWVYPYDYSSDPAAEADRREVEQGEGDIKDAISRATSAFWKRRAEYADKWLQKNPAALREWRDFAHACKVTSIRYSKKCTDKRKNISTSDNNEALYEETRNPLYVWQAISQAFSDSNMKKSGGLEAFLKQEEAFSIPGWCAREVGRVAGMLSSLGIGSDGYVTTNEIIRALRLTSRGSNAYRMREKRRDHQNKADYTRELIDSGLPPQRARAVAYPQIGDARALRRASHKVPPRANVAPNRDPPG